MSHCITGIETSNKILKNILEKKTITFGAGKKPISTTTGIITLADNVVFFSQIPVRWNTSIAKEANEKHINQPRVFFKK